MQKELAQASPGKERYNHLKIPIEFLIILFLYINYQLEKNYFTILYFVLNMPKIALFLMAK